MNTLQPPPKAANSPSRSEHYHRARKTYAAAGFSLLRRKSDALFNERFVIDSNTRERFRSPKPQRNLFLWANSQVDRFAGWCQAARGGPSNGIKQRDLFMFSVEFRRRLQFGKYTKWAIDLTEDQMEALLWAVGEYGCRSYEPLDLLHRFAAKDAFFARYNAGLEAIAQFTGGHPMNLERFFERLRQATTAVRAEPQPLPVRSALYQEGQVIITLTSGMELRFPVSENARLAQGTEEQLNQIEISLSEIHWPALSVCLPFRRLLAGDYGQQTTHL